MILHGNQRGGAKDLALHLMKDENERVEIHEMRGFVAGTLEGAFQESYAISKATKCKQHLYSLSINPPANSALGPEHFVDAANQAEERLGLNGQPRAIVFHEKHGADGILRRHAHAVWCRIDPVTMTAKQLSYDREKLREVSRDLHIQHNLKMPEGLVNSQNRNPRNFSLAEWQQCKRAEKNPKQVKSIFQDCWAISDSKAAFQNALEERGYVLAQGRRGHVAVDFNGEKYPVSRYVGIKARDVRTRLGEADGLPSVEEAYERASAQVTERLAELKTQQQSEIDRKREAAATQEETLKEKHAEQIATQQAMQEERQRTEEEQRQAKLRDGLLGLWDRFTGRRKATELQNQFEAAKAEERDHAQRKQLEEQQQKRTAALQEQAEQARRQNEKAVEELTQDIEQFAPKQEPSTQQRSYAEEQRAIAQEAQQNYAREGPRLER